MSNAIVFKSFRFEAAHWLPGVASGHKCGRMHGHSYRLVVGLQGKIDGATGMVIDFDFIKHHVKPLVDVLDHRCLNEIEGLENPTSENLCVWFFNRLNGQVCGLRYVEVWETETCGSRVEA